MHGSIARRVSSYLNYNKLNSPEGFVPFENLFKDYLGIRDYSNIEGKVKSWVNKEFSGIIFNKQNESKFKDCKWAHLIEFAPPNTDEYRGKLLDVNMISNIFTNSIKRKSNPDEGMRLTEAGEFFMYITADFEFFSRRYAAQYEPLFYSCNYIKK